MLKDDLKKDLTASLKNKDAMSRSVLGMLLTAVQNKELAKRTRLSKEVSDVKELQNKSELSDEEVLDVIASEIKKRRDAKEQFEKGNRADLASREEAEMVVLSKYMPAQMSIEDVKATIKTIVENSGAAGSADMGRVMGLVMKELKGKADGNTVQGVVKELLS